MGILPLKSFFPEVDENTLKTLSEDPDFIKHLPGLILSRFDADKVLPSDGAVVTGFFSRADFATEEEQVYVSSRFQKYFSVNKKGFLPVATDYLKEYNEAKSVGKQRYMQVSSDFASRCLFSLAMFPEALDRLYQRGAPHPDFYRTLGKNVFQTINHEDVSQHFIDWELFIRNDAFH